MCKVKNEKSTEPSKNPKVYEYKNYKIKKNKKISCIEIKNKP